MGMEDITEQQSENKEVNEDHADMGDDKEDGTAVDLNPEFFGEDDLVSETTVPRKYKHVLQVWPRPADRLDW